MKHISIKLTTVLVLALSFSNISLSQRWSDLMLEENANFFEIQAAFEKEWNGKSYEKGKGYKQFKRWEYFMQDRILPDGTFPKGDQLGDFKRKLLSSDNYLARKTGNTGDWNPIGPFSHTNTNSWSPGTGRVNFIIEDPNNSNVLYGGAPAGGVWKSINAGSSWTPISDQLSSIGISSIAVDYNNSDIIYIATGDRDGGDTYSIGIMKSIDGGLTWNTTGNISGNTNDILIDPTNSDILWAATRTAIYKSTDAGDSWLVKQYGIFDDIEFKPNDYTTIYGVTSNDFYKTTDGNTFTNITSGIPTSGGRLGIAVTPANNSYVYLLSANTDDSFQGIYRSTDSGNNFTPRNTTTDIFDGSTQAYYDMAIGASSTDADLIFCGVLNIWKSSNGGSNFSQVNSWSNPSGPAYTHADIHFIKYYGTNLYTGTDGGLYKSTNDGSSFTDLSSGLQIGQYYKIGGCQNDVDAIAGGLQDNGQFYYNGTDWKVWNGADGMEAGIVPNNSSVVYGMIQYGELYESTNGGNSGNYIGTPNGEEGQWVTPMDMDPNSTRLLAGYDHLYEYNFSNGWNQLTTFNFSGQLTNIEIYEGNSDIIYMSTSQKLYKTLNNGTDVISASTGLPNFSSGQNITSIEVNPNNSDQVWISISGWTSSRHVLYSSTGGDSWINLTGNLPNLPCNIIKYDEGTDGGIYAGTDVGVYYRDNATGTWEEYMTGLPNVIVKDLEINEANDIIRAGTYGRGVWESPTNSLCSGIIAQKIIANSTCGINNGTISTTVTGGQAPYAYTWSSGATTTSIQNLIAGEYKLTITDGTTCKVTFNYTLTDPGNPTVTLNGSNPTCGNTSGNITMGVSGGGNIDNMIWNDGSSDPFLFNLTGGIYTVTYTDINQCYDIKSTTLTDYGNVSVTLSPYQPSCLNNDGQVTGNVTGGRTPYNYTWSNQGSTETISGLSEGPYSLTIHDSDNCNLSNTVSLSISNPISHTMTATSNTCGLNNGGTGIQVFGGNGNYSYSWNNGITTSINPNLLSGNYHVTVIDAGGCNFVASELITPIGVITISADSTSTTCGLNDGTAFVIVSGGTSPYYYTWDNGESVNTINNLAANIYNTTVSDLNGCTRYETISIKHSSSPDIILSSTNPSCGDNNGAVTANISGGITPYSYSWSNNSTTTQISNLSESSYQLTVSDNIGCIKTKQTTITNSGFPSISITSKTEALCFDVNNGIAQTETNGGSTPYTYLWSNGNNVQSPQNLASGTHNVTVFDANMCTNETDVTISYIPSMLVNHQTTLASCGVNDGSAILTVTLGSAPYRYLWIGNATTSAVDNIGAGINQVEITDNNNCFITYNVTIEENNNLSLNIITSNISCNNLEDGSSAANISGGATPYTYYWLSTGQSTAKITGLNEGTYTLEVQDNNECKAYESITIYNPTPINVTTNTVDALCHKPTGEASVVATGGNSPYSYLWSNGLTEYAITGVLPDTLNISITDNNNCLSLDSVIIIGIGDVNVNSLVQDINCYGASNGSVMAIASGNFNPYTYKWSTGNSTSHVPNIGEGEYTLTITDNNDCEYFEIFTITSPTEIVINETLIHDSLENCTGQISTLISGGSPAYTIAWNDPQNQNTADAINLCEGFYNILVTDANNCKLSETYYVDGKTTTEVKEFNKFHTLKIIPNPNNGLFNIRFINNLEKVSIVIVNYNGQTVFNRNYDHVELNKTIEVDVSEYSKGIYFLNLNYYKGHEVRKIIFN